ncbi:hypothetical protein EDD37DRAFT_612220 [Exophiala viscosa]|uniref:uncharacterized protein n=1 Tax=Exophiala viscosa TaxID=2486360 RepID=UPI00219561D4|nr:hypothetical protein EDD37DRAFT_612220 [Exophiala viscosa]
MTPSFATGIAISIYAHMTSSNSRIFTSYSAFLYLIGNVIKPFYCGLDRQDVERWSQEMLSRHPVDFNNMASITELLNEFPPTRRRAEIGNVHAYHAQSSAATKTWCLAPNKPSTPHIRYSSPFEPICERG